VQGAASNSELPSVAHHSSKCGQSAARTLDTSVSGVGGVLPDVDARATATATVQVKLEIVGTQAYRWSPQFITAIEKDTDPRDASSRERKKQMHADEEWKVQEDGEEDEDAREEEEGEEGKEEEEEEWFAGIDVPELPVS